MAQLQLRSIYSLVCTHFKQPVKFVFKMLFRYHDLMYVRATLEEKNTT